MESGKWDIKMSSSEVAKALIRSHESVKPRKTTTLKDLEALLSDQTFAQDPLERQQTQKYEVFG